MLTADQIAEFERRAAAGEKPQHPGWKRDAGGMLKIHAPIELLIRIIDWTDVDGTWDLSWGINGDRYCLKFISLPAAQLAAEALLMEATAPLWAETVKALKKAAGALRSIQTVKSVEPNPLLSLEQIFDIMETVNLAAIEAAAKKASKQA